MGFFPLCDRDPLVRLLHDVFGANIVRVPDGRIQPLSALAHSEGRTVFRGALAPLLQGSEPLPVAAARSPVADIAGRRSRAVTLDLGLHLLGGFLAGFGIPAAGVGALFQGVESLAFAFPEVQRTAVDINQLGRALSQRRLDRNNPAAAIFFEQPSHELLVIDSILSSRQIALTLAGARNRQMRFDLAGFEQLVTGVGGRVALSDAPETRLVIECAREVTFAFTCVRLFYDQEGLITALPPDVRFRTLTDSSAAEVRYSPDRVLLVSRPGLLSVVYS